MSEKKYFYNSVIYGKRIEIAVAENYDGSLSGFAEAICMHKSTFFRLKEGTVRGTNYSHIQLICRKLGICIGIILNDEDCEPDNREISFEQAEQIRSRIVKLPEACPMHITRKGAD